MSSASGFALAMAKLLLTALLGVLVCSARAAEPRLVFAHYLLYYPDSLDVLKAEIRLAQSKGIDAFALNTNVWRQERADMMYQAAMEVGTQFKLFFSADIHKDANGNLKPDEIVTMLTRYANHTNQLRYAGKQFFSAWLGSDDSWWADYGYASAIAGWQDVFAKAGGKDKLFFVPFFPTDGSKYGVLGIIDKFKSIVDGLHAWDTSAWPYFDSNYQTPSDQNDRNYLEGCTANGKAYMASPSPWFFKNIHGECCSTDCQSQSVNCECQVKGNYQGPGLWITRWQQLINLQPPLLEIVTWNNWAESSYVAPPLSGGASDAAASGAASDVVAFTHGAFLELGEHYIQWYKSGSKPAVNEDSLYIFYYTHSKSVSVASEGCPVLHSDQLSDKVYVTALLKDPAVVEVQSGGTTQTFNASTGVSTWSVAFAEGQQSATLKRGGSVVLMVNGAQPISNSISKYNFNAYSTREPLRRSTQPRRCRRRALHSRKASSLPR